MKQSLFIRILFCILGLFCFEEINASSENSNLSNHFIKLCENVYLVSEIRPKFKESEIRWLCGDSENPAYVNIPLYQAKLHAKAFLQQRGYGEAQFDVVDDKLNHIQILRIDPREALKIEETELIWKGIDSDSQFFRDALKKYHGEVLNPSTLNSIENDLARLMQEKSYACPKIQTEVYGRKLKVLIWPGEQKKLGKLDLDPVEGLIPEAFIRFQPFDEDTAYNPRALELYEKRLQRAELVQGTYFRDFCEVATIENRSDEKDLEEKFYSAGIRQSFLIGPPRTLRFGLGLSTESGPLTQLLWTHHRFNKMASTIRTGLNLSWREQTLFTQANLFTLPQHPRLSWTPHWKLLRTKYQSKSNDVVEIHNEFSFGVQQTWDGEESFWALGGGPLFVTDWFSSAKDEKFKRVSSLALAAFLEKKTHKFEYYDFHPQDGSRWNFTLDHRDSLLGADSRSTKLTGAYRRLWPLGDCGAGRCVLGWRTQIQSLISEESDISKLAPSLRAYLGAYDQLRGYAPKSLPDNDGVGAKASWATGLELRGVDLLWANWEPYVFWDGGRAGNSILTSDSPFYGALGLGLRWNSPIGLVQAYSALPRPKGFYFYAALGGEF